MCLVYVRHCSVCSLQLTHCAIAVCVPVQRAIVRLTGRRLTAPVETTTETATSAPDGTRVVPQLQDRDDVVTRVIRLLHTLSSARYSNPQDEKTCCFSLLFFAGPTASPAQLLFLLLELFVAGTQPTFVHPNAKDRGPNEQPEVKCRLGNGFCGRGHVAFASHCAMSLVAKSATQFSVVGNAS